MSDELDYDEMDQSDFDLGWDRDNPPVLRSNPKMWMQIAFQVEDDLWVSIAPIPGHSQKLTGAEVEGWIHLEPRFDL